MNELERRVKFASETRRMAVDNWVNVRPWRLLRWWRIYREVGRRLDIQENWDWDSPA